MRGTRVARSGNNADELLEYVYHEADASSTPPIDRTVLDVRSGVGPTEARRTDGSDAGIDVTDEASVGDDPPRDQ